MVVRYAYLFFLLGLACGQMAVSSASAQNVMLAQPVAVVNDRAITGYDMYTRTQLTILSSGGKYSNADSDRLRRQVLDELINEQLKMHEAIKNGIVVGDAEVQQGIESIARSNGTSAQVLLGELASRGVPQSAMYDKIRADISWVRLVGQTARSNVSISEDDVQAVVQERQRNAGRTERQLYEIFIPYSAQTPPQLAVQNANAILAQLQAGARFSDLARQYSASGTKERGGDMGWVLQGELEPALEQAIADLPAGQITPPVQTQTGVYLLGVRNVRQIGGSAQGRPMMALKQLFFAIPGDFRAPQNQEKLALADRIYKSVRGCQEFDRQIAAIGDQGSGDMGNLAVDTLPPQLAAVLNRTPVQMPTQPVPVPNGASIFMPCRKWVDAPKVAADEESIKKRLVDERLETMAGRFLRELREKAVIEIISQ